MDESLQMEQHLNRLAMLIRRHAPSSGTYQTVVPDLLLMHAIEISEPVETVHKPSICIVAQGAKTATLREETFRYDPMHYLLVSVELPTIGKIIEASPDHPYLSLKLSFDTDVILDVVKDMMHRHAHSTEARRGITVNRITPELLEAIVRLMTLLDAPEDIPVLAPLILREIVYRVLQGENGALLHHSAIIGSHSHSIAQAIQQIKREYHLPLAIEQLAKSVNLSGSAFHKHFKRVTAMSPLQYQKAVRLQEARRLMLSEALQASDAAYRVGYESPSQFSREYTRAFGQPPMQDIQEQRGLSGAIVE